MTNIDMKTLHRFYSYQNHRFPIIILAISLFPAILSSAAIMSLTVDMTKVFLSLLASILYLLHIRIIDEHRDFHHDNTHHSYRPIQIGIISKRELSFIDFVSIFSLSRVN